MTGRLLLAIVTLVIVGCSADEKRTGESETFSRYWQRYVDRYAALDKIPEGVRERERWRTTTSAMSDRRIEWLIRNDYAPPDAADAEWRNTHSFVTVGTDWTRYAMLSNGSCTTREDCMRQTRAIARRKCADYQFRVVVGHVELGGRHIGERPMSSVGVIPFGVREYRGALVTNEGQRLSVTWSSSWLGSDDKGDPLDDRPHRFWLQRLPHAQHWEVERWSGMAEPPNAVPLTSANCIAQLGVWPSTH